MSFEFDHFDSPPEISDREILQALNREQEQTPDFTRSIMGRLGYMQAAGKVSRRRRIHRWMRRGVLMTAAMVALAVGINLFNQSSDARRPIHTTLHEAFGQDFRIHQERIGTLIQTFRQLTPIPLSELKPEAGEAVPATEETDGELPQVARAPYRWF